MTFTKLSLKKVAIIVTVMISLMLTGCGITAKRLHGHAGYADIESPYFWQADSKLNLSIGPATLRAARWFTSIDKESEVKALLKSVKGVRISIYNIDDNSDIFQENIAKTQANLNADGWFPVVQMNDKASNEKNLMYMKSDGDNIDGLVVLTLDKEEAVFVNVIGNIKPESFATVMDGVYKSEEIQ